MAKKVLQSTRAAGLGPAAPPAAATAPLLTLATLKHRDGPPPLRVFFDVETTVSYQFTDVHSDHIIEMAAVCAGHQAFTRVIKSAKPIYQGCVDAGLTRTVVDGGVSFKQAFSDLMGWLDRKRADNQEVVFIGHNACRFDFPILINEMVRHDISLELLVQKRIFFADTLQYCRKKWKRATARRGGVVQCKDNEVPDHKLPTVHKKATGQELTNIHRALTDAKACQAICDADPQCAQKLFIKTKAEIALSAMCVTKEIRAALETSERLYEEFAPTINADYDCEHILQDAWHYMQHLNGLSNGNTTCMKRLFVSMLSRAMFKFVEKSPDPNNPIASHEDVVRHLETLYRGAMNDAQWQDFLLLVPYSYWKSHCRTVCPDPQTMLRDVLDVYQCFLYVRDPETATKEEPAGFPFYKRGHEELLRTQLAYICRGLLSDPPGLCLYSSTARYKKTGLEIFKCHRGTNMLEGFHTDLQVLYGIAEHVVGFFQRYPSESFFAYIN